MGVSVINIQVYRSREGDSKRNVKKKYRLLFNMKEMY